ncbi:hypothetical protein KAR91_14540, partial [Candidatus Pacearchaeota archaeon]|nr:hypothetical protein [Candidatus Pacearchaeota archaeon]
ENLANWMVETPTFSMDATPLMALLADMAKAQQAEVMALRAQQPQPKEKSKTFHEPIGFGGKGYYT